LRRAAWRPILARLSPCSGRLYGRPAVSLDGRFRGPDAFGVLSRQVGAEEMRDEDHIEIERLLSPEDVARVCGLSRRAVYRAIARGELRAARLCHRLRIHPAELEGWIAGETRGTSPPPSRRVRRPATGAEGGLRVLLDEGAEG